MFLACFSNDGNVFNGKVLKEHDTYFLVDRSFRYDRKKEDEKESSKHNNSLSKSLHYTRMLTEDELGRLEKEASDKHQAFLLAWLKENKPENL